MSEKLNTYNKKNMCNATNVQKTVGWVQKRENEPCETNKVKESGNANM